MYIANLVKEDGLNQEEWRLLLDTEKNALFHKFNLIAVRCVLGVSLFVQIP